MHEAWSASGQADMVLREWGDEWAVYAGSSGHTHLLSAAAGKILAELRQAGRPMTPAALLHALRDQTLTTEDEPAGGPAEQESMVRAMLLELARIGLATMCSP